MGKTKYGLEAEKLERHRKASAQHDQAMAELEGTVKAQKKEIKRLQTIIDQSGYGDAHQKAELNLLRQNVETLESNLRTKDFEIRKLNNNMKAMGGGDEAHEAKDNANLKLLESQVQELK